MRLCITSTAIGLRVKDGVVFAVEKLVQSKLLIPGANRRIQTIDRHLGFVRAQAYITYVCAKRKLGDGWSGG